MTPEMFEKPQIYDQYAPILKFKDLEKSFD